VSAPKPPACVHAATTGEHGTNRPNRSLAVFLFRFLTDARHRCGDIERQFGVFVARFVHDDELALVLTLQLLVGVEQLDAVNRAIGSEIDIEFVTDVDGFHRTRFS
jgi:hypothetical protein